MIKLITTVIRTFILYFIVTIAIRLMGKRQIGDMQPNELVVTLLISEIAAIPLQDSEQPVLNGISAIFTLVLIEIIISVLAMKCFFVRKIMSGKSVIIIKNGVIDQQAMSDVRMTVLDLIELLRGQNIFSIEDVSFAVLEVNGDLSVLLKKDAQTVTVKDLREEPCEDVLSLPVISDGKLIRESLRALQTEPSAIYKKLKKENTNVKNVFLMTLDRNGNEKIIKKGGKI